MIHPIWKKCKYCFLSCALVLPLFASNAAIEKLDEGFVKETLALSPTTASSQGYHAHNGVDLDELLDDYSPAGMQKAAALYRHYLSEVVRLAHGNESMEDRTDLDIIRLQCEAQLLDLEHIRSYRHNPTGYVEMIGNGIYQPFVQNYAPEHARLAQITARIERSATSTPQSASSSMRRLFGFPSPRPRTKATSVSSTKTFAPRSHRSERPLR